MLAVVSFRSQIRYDDDAWLITWISRLVQLLDWSFILHPSSNSLLLLSIATASERFLVIAGQVLAHSQLLTVVVPREKL